MNPETLLNEVAEAIKHRGICITGGYHICFLQGKIDCVSSSVLIEQKYIFGTYTARDLKKGLTTKQWDELSANIANFYRKECARCQDQKQ